MFKSNDIRIPYSENPLLTVKDTVLITYQCRDLLRHSSAQIMTHSLKKIVECFNYKYQSVPKIGSARYFSMKCFSLTFSLPFLIPDT